MPLTPTPVSEADPRRPYKAIAALLAPALVAVLDVLIDGGKRDEWPAWLLLILAALLAGVSTFLVRNPKVGERKPATKPATKPGN